MTSLQDIPLFLKGQRQRAERRYPENMQQPQPNGGYGPPAHYQEEQQALPPPEMPQQYYVQDQTDRPMAVFNWFWPAFCWLVFSFNFMIMGLVVRDMIATKYDWLAHLTCAFVGVFSFAVLAGIYHYVLMAHVFTLPQVPAGQNYHP